MMRDPLPVPRAYARFGLLLGALPVAALFFRLIFHLPNLVPLWPLFLVMEILCAVAGWRMASWLGRKTEASAVQSWHEFVYDAMEAGAMWAVVTGALGGIPFFVVGSFFGALLALPIGIIAFTVFMPLHRLLARGGMIDARHLWPLACGVVATITALILSPEIIPY